MQNSEQHTDLSTFAFVDHDREERQGFPEVIFGERKTPEQVAQIAREIYARSGRLLVTRVGEEYYTALRDILPQAVYYPLARVIAITPEQTRIPDHLKNATIALLCAGTSDLPVLEETKRTLEVCGVGTILSIADVGVAGIHRLFHRQTEFENADIIIVFAGMEGALPSVVGGLTKVPVIAVPTSVGYGASFQGLAALLGMLNSCASGLTVVNIDNGFGAAMAAFRILTAIGSHRDRTSS